MNTVKWNVPRSKSAFDISTTAIDEFVLPGHVNTGIRPLRFVQSVLDKREKLLTAQGDEFLNISRRASEVPMGKPPTPKTQGVRRQSLFDKALNGTLKNDIKNLWARRSSLSLFKVKSQSSPIASDEESLQSSQESLDELMKEMGGFFVVDRAAWVPPQDETPAPPPPKRRSFSLFGRKKDD